MGCSVRHGKVGHGFPSSAASVGHGAVGWPFSRLGRRRRRLEITRRQLPSGPEVTDSRIFRMPAPSLIACLLKRGGATRNLVRRGSPPLLNPHTPRSAHENLRFCANSILFVFDVVRAGDHGQRGVTQWPSIRSAGRVRRRDASNTVMNGGWSHCRERSQGAISTGDGLVPRNDHLIIVRYQWPV